MYLIILGALQAVVKKCKVGASVLDLATTGDAYIVQQTKKVTIKAKDNEEKGVQRGIAFPTSIAVNECVGNLSPEATETRVLAEGDIVKMFVHYFDIHKFCLQ